MAVNKLIWYEEPWLKCMVSLNPATAGEITFVIIDEKSNEYEITSPHYSFNVNPAGSTAQIIRCGNKVTRVGATSIIYQGERVSRIGNNAIYYSGQLLIRIGSINIIYQSNKIAQVGKTRISYNGQKVGRVGNASLTYSGDVVANVYGNVK